jgi:DNA primase
VEGPLDVIQLHQAGFTQAVACLGTSVSALQLQIMQRHGMKHLLVALDGDSAGQAATERLLLQLQPELMRGQLSASVVPLPEGQDPDGLLRQQGAGALEGLLASAQHWLEWRLDRLLAPVAQAVGRSDLQALQVIEREGQALLQQLPEGVLRQRAEQRLAQAFDSTAGAGSSNPPLVAPLAPGMDASTARQRAERRVLRLFIHSPQCRELLRCLALQDPACRIALEWLNNLAAIAVDGAIVAMAQRLSFQLPATLGAVISQAATPGTEVAALLQKDPHGELHVLLDLLEPMRLIQEAP